MKLALVQCSVSFKDKSTLTFRFQPEKEKTRETRERWRSLMKRLVFVFSLALLIGLFALPGYVMLSYGDSNSSDQGQVTVPESNQEQVTAPKSQEQAVAPKSQEQAVAPKAKAHAKAKTHRKTASHRRYYRDYDRPYARYPGGYYDPYYNGYYPRNYYYGPGIGVDTPFFGFRIF